MGSNVTQAAGIAVFLIAFVLIAGGLAAGSLLLDLVGLAVLAASAGLFMKCKPLEHSEE